MVYHWVRGVNTWTVWGSEQRLCVLLCSHSAPLKLLCDNMKNQIISRAFYGCKSASGSFKHSSSFFFCFILKCITLYAKSAGTWMVMGYHLYPALRDVSRVQWCEGYWYWNPGFIRWLLLLHPQKVWIEETQKLERDPPWSVRSPFSSIAEGAREPDPSASSCLYLLWHMRPAPVPFRRVSSRLAPGLATHNPLSATWRVWYDDCTEGLPFRHFHKQPTWLQVMCPTFRCSDWL